MSNQDYIHQFFGPGGLLAKEFPGYQPRQSQIELAYAVDEAMQGGEYLFAEAPTGTGKSIGYGVPASYVAGTKSQRVVIVTANIALQEQLVKKDLPLIQRVAPWKFEFALAKGINNYLCPSQMDTSVNEIAFDGLAPELKRMWADIVKWSNTTTSGDLSELTFEPPPALRAKFTTTSDECIGRKCSFYDECPAIAAKREFKRAQVVVTNYSMFFIDLMMRGESGGEGILPQYTHVVFDEGHKAADIAREHFGFQLSRYAVDTVMKMLDAPSGPNAKKGPMYTLDAELKREGMLRADVFFDALEQLKRSKKYTIRIREPLEGDVRSAAVNLQDALQAAAKTFTEASSDIRLTEERRAEMQMFGHRCERYSNDIASVLLPDSFLNGKFVYFLEERGRSVSLCGKPVTVSEFMTKYLFKETSQKAKANSVTVTSATLEMNLAKRQLGVKNPIEIVVDSPFDLKRQMLLVLPPMPDPTSPAFPKRLGSRLVEVLNNSNGRALCLFTSYKMMDEAYDAVVQAGLPFTIMKQGDKPRTQLIEEFKADTSSVLFGTESFWAGVDVPGESLSVLTIDRIPFPNITDPVQDALKEIHQRTYFFDHSVPAAKLQFRQGVGRLIRSVGDVGVVVCFDSRMLEKPYGQQFIKALTREGVEYTRDINEIGHFLATAHATDNVAGD